MLGVIVAGASVYVAFKRDVDRLWATLNEHIQEDEGVQAQHAEKLRVLETGVTAQVATIGLHSTGLTRLETLHEEQGRYNARMDAAIAKLHEALDARDERQHQLMRELGDLLMNLKQGRP